ncbi:MAG: hypothetical protein AAGJ54_03655 [Planctomycetota bacterium]
MSGRNGATRVVETFRVGDVQARIRQATGETGEIYFFQFAPVGEDLDRGLLFQTDELVDLVAGVRRAMELTVRRYEKRVA